MDPVVPVTHCRLSFIIHELTQMFFIHPFPGDVQDVQIGDRKTIHIVRKLKAILPRRGLDS